MQVADWGSFFIGWITGMALLFVVVALIISVSEE